MISDAQLEFHHDPTPRDIRALVISALEPEKGGLLWDIGAGSGAVALEWIAAKRGNQAIAIECELPYVEMLKRNAGLLKDLGANLNDLTVVYGDATEILKTARVPNAVFLGCPAQVPDAFVEALYDRLSAGGRLVSNAIQTSSIERIMRALRNHSDQGGVLRIDLAVIQADGTLRSAPTRHQLRLTKTLPHEPISL
jgi:precorrin-6Y C5,15-methyltransferase (decarboxylating)